MQTAGNRKHGTGSSVQKLKHITAVTVLGASGVLAGCRQDMHDQPKFYPQRGTDFYADQRSVRPQVENTVARGQVQDDYFMTGMTNGAEGNTFPFPVTIDVLHRGQERYNIYCTPCHSRVGNGGGEIVQRGYRPAGNFHTDRLRSAPLGHFYAVIANGYGAMPDYSAQLTPADRWAVVAYIKALQLSQNAGAADVASGQHPQPLKDIADQAGFKDNPGFVYDWNLPPTANVVGTPNGQDNGIPGQDKALGGPATPAKSILSKPGMANPTPSGAHPPTSPEQRGAAPTQ